MKYTVFFFLVLIPATLMAQDEVKSSKVTVKSIEDNKDVVVLTVQEGKATFDLQCNKTMPSCANPGKGDFLMVRLPKNHGAYDCDNADLFKAGANPETDDRIGQFCIVK